MKKNKRKKDAVLRAAELSLLPTYKWPKIAVYYFKDSFCYNPLPEPRELVALAHYAQLEEDLPCSIAGYKVTKSGRLRFAEIKRNSAVFRANELLCVLTSLNMPKLAYKYMHAVMGDRCSQKTETLLIALAHYAQLEEHFSCRDPEYIPKKSDKELFKKVKEEFEKQA